MSRAASAPSPVGVARGPLRRTVEVLAFMERTPSVRGEMGRDDSRSQQARRIGGRVKRLERDEPQPYECDEDDELRNDERGFRSGRRQSMQERHLYERLGAQ